MFKKLFLSISNKASKLLANIKIKAVLFLNGIKSILVNFLLVINQQKNYLFNIPSQIGKYFNKVRMKYKYEHLPNLWLRIEKIKRRIEIIRKNYLILILFLISQFLIVSSLYIYRLDICLYLDQFERLKNLQVIYLTLGGSLIGASAITFSINMFAIQNNFERMPFSMFKRISADKFQIFQYLVSFFMSICILSISIFDQLAFAPFLLGVALVGTSLVLSSLYLAYQRAIWLINPTNQLNNMLMKARKRTQKITKLANRVAPDFKDEQNNSDKNRLSFLTSNNWVLNYLFKDVDNSISFARKYASQYDLDITSHALSALPNLNRYYLDVRKKTILFSDAFISHTLKQLDEYTEEAMQSGNEKQINLSFKTYFELSVIYNKIPAFADEFHQFHSNLATFHLCSVVKRANSLNKEDLSMSGLSYISQIPHNINAYSNQEIVTTISKTIKEVSFANLPLQSFSPVALTGMQHLVMLFQNVAIHETNGSSFLLEKVAADIHEITKWILLIPAGDFGSIHRNTLSPFYGTNFLDWFNLLANKFVESNGNDLETLNTIKNLVAWLESSRQSYVELYKDMVSERLTFLSVFAYWISQISIILLNIASVLKENDAFKDEVKKVSSWHMSILTFAQKGIETARFINGLDIINYQFEYAIQSHSLGFTDLAIATRKEIIHQAFKNAEYSDLDHEITEIFEAIACLTVNFEDGNDNILEILEGNILSAEKFNIENKKFLHGRLKNLSNNLPSGHRSSSKIEYALSHFDATELKNILEKISELFKPNVDVES